MKLKQSILAVLPRGHCHRPITCVPNSPTCWDTLLQPIHLIKCPSGSSIICNAGDSRIIAFHLTPSVPHLFVYVKKKKKTGSVWMLMDFSVSTRTRFPEICPKLFFIQWTDKFVRGDGSTKEKETTVRKQVLFGIVDLLTAGGFMLEYFKCFRAKVNKS